MLPWLVFWHTVQATLKHHSADACIATRSTALPLLPKRRYHQSRLLSADTPEETNGDASTGKDWLLLKNAKYVHVTRGLVFFGAPAGV